MPQVAGIPEPVERAIANPSPYSGEDHEKRDLAAQEAMAVWAFWMALAALGTLVVTGFGTLLIWRQVALTREAVEDTGRATLAMNEGNKIARDAAYHNIRPWLAVTDIAFRSVHFDDDGRCWLGATVTVKNFGQTPCTRAWIDAIVTNFFDEEARDSAGRNRLVRGTHQMIDTVAPGEERPVDIMCVQKVDSLCDAAQGTRTLDPILITHLNYFAFDQREKHIAGQIWNMGREIYRESIQPLVEEDFLAGKTIPVVKIHRTVKIT